SDVRQIGPLHWRFELRNSVRLHDGRTLSAEHVVQSLQRATSPGALGGGLTAPSRARLEPIDQVWAEGGRYVHVRLKEPWSGCVPATGREPVAVPGQRGRLVGAGP